MGQVPSPSEILRRLSTYAEVSPSGTGCKLIGVGRLPPGKRSIGSKQGGIEFYDQGRYFTITGHLVPGSPPVINQCQAAVSELHAAVFGVEKPTTASDRTQVANQPVRETPTYGDNLAPASDRELLARAGNGSKSAKFMALWLGDWQGEYPSASEADLALARHLAFWTGHDPARIARLMWRSGLVRPKWNRPGYLSNTVERALATTQHFFNRRTYHG